jgi:hypothetical protein
LYRAPVAWKNDCGDGGTFTLFRIIGHRSGSSIIASSVFVVEQRNMTLWVLRNAVNAAQVCRGHNAEK